MSEGLEEFYSDAERAELRLAALIRAYTEDLFQISESLLMNPYVAVEERLTEVMAGIVQLHVVGHKLKTQELREAGHLLDRIEETRIPVAFQGGPIVIDGLALSEEMLRDLKPCGDIYPLRNLRRVSYRDNGVF